MVLQQHANPRARSACEGRDVAPVAHRPGPHINQRDSAFEHNLRSRNLTSSVHASVSMILCGPESPLRRMAPVEGGSLERIWRSGTPYLQTSTHGNRRRSGPSWSPPSHPAAQSGTNRTRGDWRRVEAHDALQSTLHAQSARVFRRDRLVFFDCGGATSTPRPVRRLAGNCPPPINCPGGSRDEARRGRNSRGSQCCACPTRGPTHIPPRSSRRSSVV